MFVFLVNEYLRGTINGVWVNNRGEWDVKPKTRMLALHGNVMVVFTGPPASNSVSDGGESEEREPKTHRLQAVKASVL